MTNTVVLNRAGGSNSAVMTREGQIIPEALAVINALTDLSYFDKLTINTAVEIWVNNGVWALLDGIWIMADGEYINWKNPGTYDGVAAGTLHKIKWTGVKSDESSGYINLNYNPGQDSVNFLQDAGSFGYYILHGDRSGTSWPVGGQDGSNWISAVASPTTLQLRFNGNSGQYVNYSHSENVLGLWSFNRTSATNVEFYIDDTKIDDITLATSGVPDCDMYFMGYNNNETPAYFSKKIMGMVYFGASLSASNIASIKEGFEYLLNTQKRLTTGGNVDVFEEQEGHKPYLASMYRYLGKVYQTWFKTTGKGDGTRPAMVRTIADNGVISDSYQALSSIADADDEHITPHLTVDNNGYIYVSKEYGPAHISPIRVVKSDVAGDISAGFSQINNFSGNYSYPQMMKTGDDIIMVARDNPYNVQVWKKGLTDNAFSSVGTLSTHTEGRNYPYVIKNVAEDAVWITIQIWDSTDPDPGFARIFVLKSTDGETWANVDGSFSKDITSAAITESELDSNYLLTSTTLPATVFCSGGFVENGSPVLLMEEGAQTAVGGNEGWRDTDTLAIYTYSSGWVRTQIRTGLTMFSRHDSYMHNATYLTYNGDEYIIFSYKDNDNTVLEKWVSTDLISWQLDETWEDGDGLKFAWPSNDVQNTATVGENMLITSRFDPDMTANIDTFSIQNIKRF